MPASSSYSSPFIPGKEGAVCELDHPAISQHVYDVLSDASQLLLIFLALLLIALCAWTIEEWWWFIELQENEKKGRMQINSRESN
jgi:hypothetical protein